MSRPQKDGGGAVVLALAAAAVLGTMTVIVGRFTFAPPTDVELRVLQDRLLDGLDTGLAAAVENVRRDPATCHVATVDLDDVDDLDGPDIRVVVACMPLDGDRYRFVSTGYIPQTACSSGDRLSAAPALGADVTMLPAARDARQARVDRRQLDPSAPRCQIGPR